MPAIRDDPSKKAKYTAINFDWISYAALGKNSTLQGIGMVGQCTNVVVVVALIFTDFMMGGNDPYINGSVVILVATYTWLGTVVLNGSLHILMELIVMSCDCDGSSVLNCVKRIFVVVWFLTPVVYFVASVMLVYESEYLASRKGGLMWPIAMVVATITQTCLKAFALNLAYDHSQTICKEDYV